MSAVRAPVPPDAVTPPPSGIIIEAVAPQLDCGRYPVKREVGDELEVTADIFREGHGRLSAVLRYRGTSDSNWTEAEMHHVDNDRWSGSFTLTENTRYLYTIEAFPDVFGTWREELDKKIDAGLDVTSELHEGSQILSLAAARATGEDKTLLGAAAATLVRGTPDEAVVAVRSPALIDAMQRNRSRAGSATFERELSVVVDRVAARYAAWYELFPRSAGTVPGQSGTFADVCTRLPAIAAMGFDVLYFPPIHPIGHSHRKGPNNSLVTGPNDPGVPYAIGNELGGHDALEPSLGTFKDFEALVNAARDHGLEIALDLAIQCSPDHPWVREHPEWFYIRPDGTIKYAENPPKKYEDIYPVNFDTPDWWNLWQELRRIVLFWVERGVTMFRVDNPHTKPTVFWEWLIAEVQQVHPGTVFLSEAFTRPKVMKTLAKAGFTQSYTYFTWRNFKREIGEYFTELTQTEMKEYYRGNLFANTPDILPYILQEGGRPGFMLRLGLAATLSSVYGIYSGYELCENAAVPGKEEYADSEKYDYKVWDWDRPGNIVDFVTAINRIRREHPALHDYDNLRFYGADDDNMICYGKSTADRSDIVIVVVNLDPFQPHETLIHLPLGEFGIGEEEQYRAIELLSGEPYIWTGASQQVRLDPGSESVKVFALSRWPQVDYAEPCY